MQSSIDFDAMTAKESLRTLSRGSQTEQPVHVGREYCGTTENDVEGVKSVTLSLSTLHTSIVCWGQLLKPHFPHLYNGNNANNVISHPKE